MSSVLNVTHRTYFLSAQGMGTPIMCGLDTWVSSHTQHFFFKHLCSMRRHHSGASSGMQCWEWGPLLNTSALQTGELEKATTFKGIWCCLIICLCNTPFHESFDICQVCGRRHLVNSYTSRSSICSNGLVSTCTMANRTLQGLPWDASH